MQMNYNLVAKDLNFVEKNIKFVMIFDFLRILWVKHRNIS